MSETTKKKTTKKVLEEVELQTESEDKMDDVLKTEPAEMKEGE